MRACTWQNCNGEAHHMQVASDGEIWADLCEGHHEALETYFKKDAPTVTRAWIFAQGGPQIAGKRLADTMRNALGRVRKLAQS